MYDALNSFLGHEALRELCVSSTELARTADAAMPAMDPTHLLLLLYAKGKKLGWHRDDGGIDGRSLQPVVSLSLGNACDFWLKDQPKDEPIRVRLESGDLILFGGPARHIMHTVHAIYPGTAPKNLLARHAELTAKLAPCPAFASSTSDAEGFRVNLTFRHAPELQGMEGEERFFHFASATRGFLATQREHGTEAARKEVAERRAKRKVQQKERKLRKQQAKRQKQGGEAAAAAIDEG